MKNPFNHKLQCFNVSQKIITGILIFATVFSFTFSVKTDSNFSSFSFQPEKAEAVPSFDIGNFIKEIILDLISWIAADLMVSFASWEILLWSNENFGGMTLQLVAEKNDEGEDVERWEVVWGDGDPSFLTNPEEFFSNMALSVADTAQGGIGKLLDSMVGSPLEINPLLLGELEESIKAKHFKPFEERIKLTRTAEEIEAFMDDFMEGGWSMWTEIMINPQNTPRGALLLAEQEVEKRLAEARAHTERELAEGGGFLPSRRCDVFFDPSIHDFNDSDAFGCVEYIDVTPGTTIESQVARAVGMDIERISAADEITEVIANLLTKVFIDLIGQGLTSVGSRTTDGEKSIEQWLKDAKSEAASAVRERDAERRRAGEELTTQAEARVVQAERSQKQEDIDHARSLLPSIPAADRERLEGRLDEIEPLEDDDETENNDTD